MKLNRIKYVLVEKNIFTVIASIHRWNCFAKINFNDNINNE